MLRTADREATNTVGDGVPPLGSAGAGLPMTPPGPQRGVEDSRRSGDRQLLLESKEWLLKELSAKGIHERAGDLMVCGVRKSRPHRVGYYGFMSQFKTRARIVVDVQSIREAMGDEFDTARQVRMTCAHEYGHMLAELLRVLKAESDVFAQLEAQWKAEFDSNEEAFAEDLARDMVMSMDVEWSGWPNFLKEVGAEMQRVFK